MHLYLPMAFNPLLIGAAAIGLTLVYASILDIRDRRVPFRTWYPMLAVAAPCTAWFYASLVQADPGMAMRLLAVSVLFTACFYLFGALGLVGGADAWALIFITLLVPIFPFPPLLDGGPGFFPFPVLVHAEAAALLAPLGLLFVNLRRGVRGPLLARLRGFPVTADQITDGRAFGFVMEDLSIVEGEVRRRFYSPAESLGAMVRGTRLYTRELRANPEEFAQEIALVRRASPVWISYGVPFIVPITIGFLVTLVVGDTIFYLLSIL